VPANVVNAASPAATLLIIVIYTSHLVFNKETQKPLGVNS